MKKLLLIINPSSGKMKSKKVLPEIAEILALGGYEVTALSTNRPGHATEFVKESAGEAEVVVCCGGDGTLNETITGIMSLEKKPMLGYIPAGTTNDFANSLGLSKDLLTAAKNIVSGSAQSIDVGKFNDKYFSYIASFGAFTDSSYMTTQPMKNMFGHLAYVLEGIKEVPNIKPRHIRLETGGSSFEGDYVFGAVCNSTSIGGIIKLEKDIVDLNDGLFEIMLIKNPKNALELSAIILSLTNQNFTNEFITFIQASEVVIHTQENISWSLDGEFNSGSSVVRAVNIHNAITLIK